MAARTASSSPDAAGWAAPDPDDAAGVCATEPGMYPPDPTDEPRFGCCEKILTNPKSETLMSQLLGDSSRMFSGLRSVCVSSNPCRNSIALRDWYAIERI